MIRVTVELVSAKDPSRDRVLGVGHIGNVGTNPDGGTNYLCALSKWAPKHGQTWKGARLTVEDRTLSEDALYAQVEGFDNVQRGAWDLLYLCLRAVVGERNR